MKFNRCIKIFIPLAIILIGIFYLARSFREQQILRQVIERLSAESRIAEVLVTDVKFDPKVNMTYTTIKFLEYDAKMKPLEPKYFTFAGNIIQFQSLVIRFDDFFIKNAHPLKGKSAYLFMKAFSLRDKDTEVFDVTRAHEIPSGYKLEKVKNNFEKILWQKFWKFALNPKEAKNLGIKNAQIEAPGTKFIPGMLYIIKIEHDGGMRIDAQALPDILKGEKINF